MSDRDKFQGLCLQSLNGWEFMPNFDEFPQIVREELRNSPFNICAACVHDAAMQLGGAYDAYTLLTAVKQIESRIRCEEVPQAQ